MMSRFEPRKKRSSAVRIFRADPRLISALHAIALLSALLGIAFFTYVNLNEDNQQAGTHLTTGIEHATAQTNLLSQELDLLRQRLQPSIDQAFAQDATPQEKLDARAALSQILNSSPATGLLAWPASGDAPLKIGTAPIIARPITDRTDTIHTPARFSTSDNKAVIVDHGLQEISGNSVAISLVLPTSSFDSLVNTSIGQMLVYNRGGDLLYAHPSETIILKDINVNADAALRDIFNTGISHTGAAWKRLDTGELIITGRSPISPAKSLWRHLLLAASIALPIWLAVAIGLWRIGNEWRRLDEDWDHAQGVTDRYDAVASAMNASVLEWSPLDGKIRYGGDWIEHFGDENLRQTDEIFHWIERIHPDDVTRARMTYERLQYGRLESSCHDIRVRSTNGDWITLRETAVVCKDEKGRPDQIFLVLQRAEVSEEPYKWANRIA